jgi:DNA-binding MarR family transcriptional regulator
MVFEITPHNNYPHAEYDLQESCARLANRGGRMAGKLRREIKQKRPFRSVQEEVVLSVVRTAEHVAVRTNEVLREAGVSPSQYNVLRILRGAGEEGLPCGEISERMVRRDPDLTRLLDRLEKGGLVVRERDTKDRRIVRASITKQGLALLDSLDAPVEESIRGALSHVPAKRLRALLELLEELRGS